MPVVLKLLLVPEFVATGLHGLLARSESKLGAFVLLLTLMLMLLVQNLYGLYLKHRVLNPEH